MTRPLAIPAASVQSPSASVSEHLLAALIEDGLSHAFGVMGGALVPIHRAMRGAPIQVVHTRHETGAVFAALEASLATERPSLAFATTGPGLTNAITGVVAARREGAHVLLVSGYTAPAKHGRFGLQETHASTLFPGLYQAGPVFDAAWTLTDPRMLPGILRALHAGWSRPQGFVAHLAVPLDVQAMESAMTPTPVGSVSPEYAVSAEVRHALCNAPTAIWIGYGARRAARQVRALAETLGAPVLATPRAKGIFPEEHPLYAGVSGSIGGEPGLARRLERAGVQQALVLGTRLGEFSATPDVVGAFERAIHVDLDPRVPGAAWPAWPTCSIAAEVGAWLDALLEGELEQRPWPEIRPLVPAVEPASSERVRPQVLMAALQTHVVAPTDALVMAESGNAFAWSARLLRFSESGRYRQAGSFAPMGQVSAGAVGAALATGRPVVAVVGDGSFLMQNEISTAVETGAPVVWVVLNDARYGMVEQGLASLGQPTTCQRFPEVDFASMGRALGAHGERLHDERSLEEALGQALKRTGPTVLDVLIDPEQPAPHGARVQSIRNQSSGE